MHFATLPLSHAAFAKFCSLCCLYSRVLNIWRIINSICPQLFFCFWLIAANYAHKMLWRPHSTPPFWAPFNAVSPLMSTLAFRFMLRASLQFLLLKKEEQRTDWKLITKICNMLRRSVLTVLAGLAGLGWAGYRPLHLLSWTATRLEPTCPAAHHSPLGISQMARGRIKTRSAVTTGAPSMNASMMRTRSSRLHFLLLRSLARNFHANKFECSVTYRRLLRFSSVA